MAISSPNVLETADMVMTCCIGRIHRSLAPDDRAGKSDCLACKRRYSHCAHFMFQSFDSRIENRMDQNGGHESERKDVPAGRLVPHLFKQGYGAEVQKVERVAYFPDEAVEA